MTISIIATAIFLGITMQSSEQHTYPNPSQLCLLSANNVEADECFLPVAPACAVFDTFTKHVNYFRKKMLAVVG